MYFFRLLCDVEQNRDEEEAGNEREVMSEIKNKVKISSVWFLAFCSGGGGRGSE